jgi:hypothetical protein
MHAGITAITELAVKSDPHAAEFSLGSHNQTLRLIKCFDHSTESRAV